MSSRLSYDVVYIKEDIYGIDCSTVWSIRPPIEISDSLAFIRIDIIQGLLDKCTTIDEIKDSLKERFGI